MRLRRKRYRPARAGVVLTMVLVGSVLACSDGEDASERRDGRIRTNVVLIVLDDLDAMTMPYWEAMPKAKARLADRGLVFANAFASSPECCPSRATILTGNYPHNTEIFDSTPPDGGYERFAANGREADTIAVRLRREGYHTSFVGKYLNGYEKDYDSVPPGWDDWFGLGEGFSAGYGYDANVDGSIRSYGTDPEDDYLTDVLADRVQETLERSEQDDDTPFFLSLWTSAPHADIDAAPRHAGHPFEAASLPRRPNFDEPDVEDKPTWLRTGMRRITPRDLDDLTERYRKMMGSLFAVDELIEGLFATLEAEGELDHTVVVFTSDNGYNFGAHRLPHKMAPYEESIRIPLVVTAPGVRAGEDEHLVLTNDIAPTVLDLAGLPTDDLDGRSLVPLLDADGEVTWRDDILVEYRGTYHPLNTVDTLADVRELVPGRVSQAPNERQLAFVPTYRAVRSERHLFVEWYGGDVHEYELYDLDADPAQLTNLVADEAGRDEHRATTEALASRLDALASCSGPSCRS